MALGHDRACQTQRVSDIAVTLTTMCYDSSLSDNHRGHCAIAPPREAPSLRLRQSDSRVCASLCDSVPVCSDSALPESVATSDRRVGGDPESPTPDPESPSRGPRLPVPESGGGIRPDGQDSTLATHQSEDTFNRVQPDSNAALAAAVAPRSLPVAVWH